MRRIGATMTRPSAYGLRSSVARAGRAAVVAALLLAGCAARSGSLPATLAQADGLADAGCYACLLQAQAIYEAALQRRPSLATTRRVFRTALLLGVREKEIGLPATGHLDRARELAPTLPDPVTAALLTAASGLPWDVASQSPEAREEFVRTSTPRGGQLQEWRAALAPHVNGDVLAAYLDAALACHYLSASERVPRVLLAPHPASVALRFAVAANCRDTALLDEVLVRDARYVEARFFRGRTTLAAAAMGRASRNAAILDLTAAYEAFPQSPSVTSAMAGLFRSLNRLDEAVRHYDETIALVPGHREALVGRTVALSYLARHDEGLATAERIIELGQWYLGDGHYWRAYNQLYRRDLDAARDAVERAKVLQPISSETFALAGMIRFERKELHDAARDLSEALRLNDANCTASWYLGLVRGQEQAWGTASAEFERAADCYAREADRLREELEALLAVLADDAERATLSSDYAKLIARDERAAARSAYNVAYASAQSGDKARALAFAERAMADEEMRPKAEELIAALSR